MATKFHIIKHFTYLMDTMLIDSVVLRGFSCIKMAMGICTLFHSLTENSMCYLESRKEVFPAKS